MPRKATEGRGRPWGVHDLGPFSAFYCLLLLSAACPRAASASSASIGTSGASFLDISQGSARAMALGHAYVGEAEGVDALTWNPAGIATASQNEIAYSYLGYVNGFSAPLYLAAVHPVGLTVWGANVGYLYDTSFDVRDVNGIPLTNYDPRVYDAFGTVSVARAFDYEKLLTGASLRVVHEDLGGYIQDNLVGDAGVEYKPRDWVSLGASMQNFGAPVSQVGNIGRVGAAFYPIEDMMFAVEADKPEDDNWRVGLGAEFNVPEEYLQWAQLAFRVGYYSSDQYGQSFNSSLQTLHLDRTSGVSFGLGLFTSRAFGYGMSLDYAFVPFGAMGIVDQFTLKFKY